MRKLFFILLIFLSQQIPAQNLISNGSFEQYTSIPTFPNQLSNAVTWINPTWASPDYLHILSTNPSISIPNSAFGHQFPRTGLAYCNIGVYHYLYSYREFACTQLISKLDSGKSYCFTFYVSPSEIEKYFCNNVGLFINDSLVYYPFDTVINVVPQFEFTPLNSFVDTINWIKLSGTYTAVGNEKVIYIGNFKNNSSSTILVNDTNHISAGSCYFIEDVSFYECNAPVYTADTGDSLKICAGGPATLGTHNLPQYLYYWYSDPARTDTLFTIANPTVYPTVTTTYYLEVIDFKFDRTYDSVKVYVYPAIPDSLISAGNDTSFCPGGSVQLGNAGGSYTYLWQPSTGLSNNAISNPICTPTQSTTYILYTSNPGCTRSDTVNVIVEDCDTAENSLNIINAFTPNNDGKNDYFHIKGTNISTVHLKIINRWGQQMYEGMGENVKWDGRYDGKEVSAGVYYYIAEVIFTDGTTQSKRGAVHLIR